MAICTPKCCTRGPKQNSCSCLCYSADLTEPRTLSVALRECPGCLAPPHTDSAPCPANKGPSPSGLLAGVWLLVRECGPAWEGWLGTPALALPGGGGVTGRGWGAAECPPPRKEAVFPEVAEPERAFRVVCSWENRG